LFLVFASLSGVAAQQEDDPQQGAAYAKQNCANCHAIANEEASLVATAPRFKHMAKTSDIRNVVAYILSLKDEEENGRALCCDGF
jgi:mono/diheme cytochrome c family protein